MKQKYLKVNNTKIYCEIYGKGTPLILLHGGMGLDSSYFKVPGILDLAKRGIQVILYDQRGHGKSQETDSKDYTHRVWIKDLKRLAKKLGLKKFNLLGHSYGGWLALEYAVKRPKELDRLILVDTHAGPVDTSDIPKYKNQAEMNKRSKEKWPQAFFSKNKHWSIFKRIKHNYKPFNAAYHRETENYDVRDKLKNIDAKTLVICGEADTFFLERSQKFVKEIPNAHLEVITKCKHFPFIEMPEDFVNIIVKFLQHR